MIDPSANLRRNMDFLSAELHGTGRQPIHITTISKHHQLRRILRLRYFTSQLPSAHYAISMSAQQ